jgi:hydroxymethylglutaryl-CoA synthase
VAHARAHAPLDDDRAPPPADAGDGVVRRCYHVPYGKMAKKAHARLCELQGVADAAVVEARFEQEVMASLRLSRRIGNIYTGSLWLALGSLLETDAATIEGQRLSLFSYGSGCTAEFFCGRVAAGAAATMAALAFSAPLAARKRLSMAEYESIRTADARATDARAEAEAGAVAAELLPPLSFRGTVEHRRVYG